MAEDFSEEMQEKIEKRADILAVTLQAIIGARLGDEGPGTKFTRHKTALNNDPFRKKNLSHNSLLQLEHVVGSGPGRAVDQVEA